MAERKVKTASVFLFFTVFLTGCTPIGDKSASLSSIYIATSVLAFLLLLGYICFIKEKQKWFYVLFVSVFVVNIGYLIASMSDTLGMALQANRISYLGSVFLPLSMLMTILNISQIKYKKWVPFALLSVSIIVFLIAASPGILNIYYKSVTLETVGGVSVLNKEYGPLHKVYLFYLLGYFVAMIGVSIYATVKKKLDSTSHAIIILVAVFVNICVWLVGQLVEIDFEFLSVSYIITELFLLGVYLMIQSQESLVASLKEQVSAAHKRAKPDVDIDSPEFAEHLEYIASQIPKLTPTEKAVYDCYMAGKSTKEVLIELSIMENTLKFHNKNLYGKLGVTSRKQLIEYGKSLKHEQIVK